MKRPTTIRYLIICVGVAFAALTSPVPDAGAQRSMPTFDVRDVAGEPSSPIPLDIELPSEILRGGQPVRENSFVMLRGLPAEIVVSAGFRVRNAWVVSFSDLDKLQLVAPVNYRGSFPLEVLLYWGKDVQPVSRQITVDIRPSTDRVQTAAPANVVPPPAPKNEFAPSTAATPKQQAGQRVPEAEESQLMSRAEKAMQLGQVAAARMIYENLAGRGSARGAYALAQTYDPVVLVPSKILGLSPDVELARQWYRKAAELGSDKATERLSAFGATDR
jgi:hypothetical protein